jgi:hypothetical protein
MIEYKEESKDCNDKELTEFTKVIEDWINS